MADSKTDDDPMPAWNLPVDKKIAHYLITHPISSIQFVMLEGGETPGLKLTSPSHAYLGAERNPTALHLPVRWFHDNRNFFEFSPHKDGFLVDHFYTKRGAEMMALFRSHYAWHKRNDFPWPP